MSGLGERPIQIAEKIAAATHPIEPDCAPLVEDSIFDQKKGALFFLAKAWKEHLISHFKMGVLKSKSGSVLWVTRSKFFLLFRHLSFFLLWNYRGHFYFCAWSLCFVFFWKYHGGSQKSQQHKKSKRVQLFFGL